MNTLPPRSGRAVLLTLVALLLAGAAAVAAFVHLHRTAPPPPVDDPPQQVTDIEARAHTFCGACHLYPPADTFPKSAWPLEVQRGYEFFSSAGMNLEVPPMDAVVAYYQERAPEELPAAEFENAKTPPPVAFKPILVPALPAKEPPAIANVNLVHLFDDKRLDVLACDMRRGQVLLYQPYLPKPAWRVLAEVPNPCHTEVVDLDGDGIKDILVANLGSYLPTDRRCGSVVWLRGKSDGTFTPYTLLENVGRVADVQAAEFRTKSGKKDLIVAAFGWNDTGEVYFLENQTTDWTKPKFQPRILDKRHGSIHVPIVDLDHDGNLDFVVLLAQQHETIVAYMGDGRGNFTPKELYRGPHPAYGSSGIQLAYINGDPKKIDILYTNGDTLDMPYLLKPYHGIQWLENKGNLKFEHHPITPMYGVHRALAADFSGTGRKDIVAVNFLPSDAFPQRKAQNLDSVIYLEQTAPGKFIRHSLETITCNHTTCAVGDIYGSGKLDFVTGNFTTSTEKELGITIWKNMGAAKDKR